MADLLNILGPVWRVAKRHEGAVGQNGAHDHKTEHRGQ